MTVTADMLILSFGSIGSVLNKTGPLNHAILKEGMGLRRTPYRLKFKSKFATPMSLYTNYLSDDLGGWVDEEED